MYVYTHVSRPLPQKQNWGGMRKARANTHPHPSTHTQTHRHTLSQHTVRGGNHRHRRQTCATSRMRRRKRAARMSAPEAWRQGWREGEEEEGTGIGIQRQRESERERGRTQTFPCIPRVLRGLRFPVQSVPFPQRRVLISDSVPLCHRGRGATENFKCPLAWKKEEPWVNKYNII
jgi:hypothetical protein